jgi:hypothetical protein
MLVHMLAICRRVCRLGKLKPEQASGLSKRNEVVGCVPVVCDCFGDGCLVWHSICISKQPESMKKISELTGVWRWLGLCQFHRQNLA